MSHFSAFSSQNNQLSANDSTATTGSMDSITLGQLKSMVAPQQKPKQSMYDFRYEDEDTVMNEIDEFFSYAEVSQVDENYKAWEGDFLGEWTKSPISKRRTHVEFLIEGLEHRDAEIRYTNARRLMYVLQGTFAETSSPEHQLHWIIENCKLVRSANGVSTIVEAIKIASQKHDVVYFFSDADAHRVNVSPTEKSDVLEETNTELSLYFGMLYLMVEVLKDYDDFAEELMSLEPPLPVVLFNVLSGLRDKSVKNYPVKKLLLVAWKTILACFGGMRDLIRAKRLARELAGLSSEMEEDVPIKSSPFDIQTFRQETSVKYPTFAPPTARAEARIEAQPCVSPLKLAQAYAPIPIRHHYHHGDEPDYHQSSTGVMHANATYMHAQIGQNTALGQTHGAIPSYNPNTQPITPVPTPPPTPKPKKQQYQTDQNRPFLFPFSRSQIDYSTDYGRAAYGDRAPTRLVPFAIDEADRLYDKHLHTSVSLLQMWRTREDCMIAESGLQHGSGLTNDTFEEVVSSATSGGSTNFTGSSISGQSKSSGSAQTKVAEDDTAEELPDVVLLDSRIAEADAILRQAQRSGDIREAKEYKERKEDLMRLRRVEQVYNAILPTLPAWVLVILKMLLATVSAVNLNQQPPSASSSAFPPGVLTPEQQPPQPPPSIEEIDITRHREITSKAVSALLLLTLKWFKVSHVMKFHHLGQLLLDSNCLLLILKMFGLQEVSTVIASKADSPDHDFFRYCYLQLSKNNQLNRPENSMLNPRQSAMRTTVYSKGTRAEEEVELLTDFSWRNFFSSINFVKVMQKLSKHRSHRIWLLVQYKSSAILKRILKVSHPMLQLHVLKLIKSQVPYCGRKWRQSNMKVITSIYLNCRPDLRDEWLTGNEVDDVQDALLQEQALRKLVKFYNNKRYGTVASHAAAQNSHRRSSSTSAAPLEGLHPGPELSAMVRPIGTPNVVEADVFPPLRAQAPDPSAFLPYVTEDIAFEEEYEEYLSDLGMSGDQAATGSLFGGTSAWHRLPHIGAEIADGISDSESIVSISDLGDEARLDVKDESDRELIDENRNNWEHMSPKTMAALPKSPVGGHRRSSSGSSLRPVLPFGLDDTSAVDLDADDIEEPEPGPMPREQTGPFAAGASVDEVEYAYGL